MRFHLPILFLITLLFPSSAMADLEWVQLHRDYTESLKLENGPLKTEALIKVRQSYQRFLLEESHPSSALHYNLGTLHLQLEEYGPAIYHLKMAHLKNPNDPRVVDHLRRASRQAGVPIANENQNLIGGWAQDTWTALPLKWIQISLLTWALVSLLLIVRAPQPKRVHRWFVCSAILSILIGLSMLRQSDWGTSKEVVLMADFNPRSGIGLAYPGILGEGKFKGGQSGTLLRQQGGWVEVSWYESGIGWVPIDRTKIVSK